jgi:lysophospholipase L1-like esterase
MRCRSRTLQTLVVLAAAFHTRSAAQTPARGITDQQAEKHYERVLQLVESGGITVPDLGKSGSPLLENMRQTLESLKFLGFQNPTLHYRFQANLRAWLLLSDTLPRPSFYPEEARRQLGELRDLQATLDSYLQQQLEQLQAAVRNPDRDNLKRYAEENARLGPASAANPRVVFLGDSITDFWRLNEYFPGKDFVNRGISGQVTGQMLGRFLADVAALKPAAVLILAGTNDIARGVDITVAQRNIQAMCDLAERNEIKVLLATLLPVSDYHMSKSPAYERTRFRPLATIRSMNDWIKGLARQRGYTVVDYYTPLLDERVQLAAGLADDGLHPNAQGYRLMAPAALQAIEKALTPPQPQPRKKRLLFQ